MTQTQEDQKIAFSLSETSFAMYPPLESHEGEFPSTIAPELLAGIPQPTPKGLPRFLRNSGEQIANESAAEKKRGVVRGDSYAGGINLMENATDLNNETAAARLSQLMIHAALSYPPPPHRQGPIIVVSCYTQFDDLAHGPRGAEAKRAMRTYRLNISDGTLTLLSMVPEGLLHNPAFCRWHPKLNVLYACTESLTQEGQVHALSLNGKTGALHEHGSPVKAGGFSTCFLTIHPSARRMLLVNYWDSTIGTLSLEPDGTLGPLISQYDPKHGRTMKASATRHVNHSLNDEAAQRERQGDPHSHAIVLEPMSGTIAYVPDLGMDVIRQFHFDEESGQLTPCGEIVSGVKVTTGRGLGPRYLAFASRGVPMCYVVNELSSQVAVFEYHPEAARRISETCHRASTAEAKAAAVQDCEPTLTLIQTVSTLPEAFPPEMNTCGRVTIHPSGDFVVTSNRGHDSVAVHRIHHDSKPPGMLTLAGIFHTRGETPRHFQFDKSGHWLLVANQDSNTCAAFAFNCATGQVSYTGNTYACQSPNFVCVWGGA